jgi:hypothetical protein
MTDKSFSKNIMIWQHISKGISMFRRRLIFPYLTLCIPMYILSGCEESSDDSRFDADIESQESALYIHGAGLYFYMELEDDSGFNVCDLVLNLPDVAPDSSDVNTVMSYIVPGSAYDSSTESWHDSAITRAPVTDMVRIRNHVIGDLSPDPIVSRDHPFITHPDALDRIELYVPPGCGTLGKIKYIKMAERFNLNPYTGNSEYFMILEKDFKDPITSAVVSDSYQEEDTIPIYKWLRGRREKDVQKAYCETLRDRSNVEKSHCESLDFQGLSLPASVKAATNDLQQLGNRKYIGPDYIPVKDFGCIESFWYYARNFSNEIYCVPPHPSSLFPNPNDCNYGDVTWGYAEPETAFYRADRLYRVVFSSSTALNSDGTDPCWEPGKANWKPNPATQIPNNLPSATHTRRCISGIFRCKKPNPFIDNIDPSDVSYCEQWDNNEPYEPKEGDYLRRKDFSRLRGSGTNSSHSMTYLGWDVLLQKVGVIEGGAVLTSGSRDFNAVINRVSGDPAYYKYEFFVGEVDNEFGGGIEQNVQIAPVHAHTMSAINSIIL